MRAVKKRPLRVMTIVHGRSEYLLCGSITSNLRIKHEMIARDKGKHSIQITSIMQVLNDNQFRNYNAFIRSYSDVEHRKGSLQNFRLFIIMDVDDCTVQQKQQFMSKQLFQDHWLCEYITPIYNDPNLEETMKQAGILVKDKKDYEDLFPINHGALEVSTVEKLMETMRQCPSTNLEEYLSYCLAIEKSQRNA